MSHHRPAAVKIALWYPLLALAIVLPTACADGLETAASPPSPSATATSTAVRATPTPLPPSPTATPPRSPTAAPSPTPCSPAAVIASRGDTALPIVLLTFDAEGDAGHVVQILATLRTEDVKAGFAVTGLWAEQYPELVRAIAVDGHSLYNHSYDHPSFTGHSAGRGPLSREERLRQLRRTEEIVVSLTGQSTKPYFRPPYGHFDNSVLCDIHAAGYRHLLLWDVDMAGFQRASVEEIVARALASAHPGAIYVMHTNSGSNDALALPRIIQGLRSMGYQFATLQK